MDLLTPITAENFFDSFSSQSDQLSTLSKQALNSGIDKYMDKDYKGAAKEFKRAFGLDPYSDYAVDAAKYQAMSHLKLGETEKAIKAYQGVLEMQPDRDDMQIALGNLYFKEGRTGEAIEAYESAVRIYDDVTNRYSLGQAYLNAGRYDDAKNQFEKVIKMDPSIANGYFGLGQTLAAQKKYPEAIEQLERSMEKRDEFWDAYAEIGYTYADAGEIDKAKEIQNELEYKDESLATLLDEYISKKTQPKMLFAWGDSSFPYYLRPKSQVSALNDYLANANSSHTFSIMFQFNKDMDRDEIENVTNWSIKRSTANGPGMDYNFGLAVPDTETRISPYPLDVYWDEDNYTATLRFTIYQNADANATIDPSHIEFSYNGKDADGNTMDPKYDQYMGFSGSF